MNCINSTGKGKMVGRNKEFEFIYIENIKLIVIARYKIIGIYTNTRN